jgi:hypothetical protein
MKSPRIPNQAGATLIVSLVFLVMITLMALTAFRLSNSNLKIVGNMQQHNQVAAIAQSAIETAISSTAFTNNPGTPTTTTVSINNSGQADVSVSTVSTCLSARTIPEHELDLNAPEDQGCAMGSNLPFGTEGANHDMSLCADTMWDIQVTATDTASNAHTVINEGAKVRVAAPANCPR